MPMPKELKDMDLHQKTEWASRIVLDGIYAGKYRDALSSIISFVSIEAFQRGVERGHVDMIQEKPKRRRKAKK
jgi:hypothetical protein